MSTPADNTDPAPLPVAPPPGDQALTQGLMQQGVMDVQDLAQVATARGLAAVEALAAIDVEIPPILGPQIDIPAIELAPAGPVPQAPAGLDLNLPDLPQAPQVPTPAALDVGSVPAYDLVPPLLIDVPLPDPFDALVPDAPVLADVAAPVEPDFTLPAVPDLVALALPEAPTFEVPTFAETLPDGPAIPDLSFTWHEIGYHSDLLADLNNRLLTFVQGDPSALPVEVERRIWDKAVDDEVAATWSATESACQGVAARGFNLPGGELLRLVQAALDAGLKQDLLASRDVMTSQARMEQANFMFAFSNAMQLENQLISLFNQVQQRALDAARFRVESMMQLFDARVNLYQADVQAFGAKAEAFKTRLSAVLAQLDVYKAELEAVKAKGQLNLQLAQQYSAQIDGVKVIADVYRARVAAVSLAVANNKNRTELYKSEIDGAAARAKAGAQAVQGYLAQVQLESSKADLFAAQVAGYASQVDAYRVLTDAKLSEANVNFKQLQQFPIEMYKGKIAAVAAATRAESARLSATAEVFGARLEGFSTEQRVATRQAVTRAELATTQVKVYASAAQVALNNAIVTARAAQNGAETAAVTARAAAQLSTQIAAATASARNFTTSYSTNTSNSSSTNYSNTRSYGTSTSSSMSTSNAKNTSISKSNTTGGVSSTNNSQTFSDNETISESSNRTNSEVISHASTVDNRSDIRNNQSASINSRNEMTKQRIYNHKG